MLELLDRHRLFVGFKMDGSLKRQLQYLQGADKRYVSEESSDFLTICRIGEDSYVGKLVEDRMTTDRVDDVRRNVLSILTRICPDTRFPTHLDIIVCPPVGEATSTTGSEEPA
ncbi:hypothetical protein ABI59_07360 [Acidobacteria bacterium Mor1]|nr:hypothetical protein ABI59_07360 [Acidobacteria bacterium Mor1]